MKSLTFDQTYSLLESSGNLKKSFVEATLRNSTRFFELTLEDEASFYSLLYPSIPACRILTPMKGYRNHHYTLGDVAERVVSQGWTFDKLVDGTLEGEYDPNFFKSCLTITSNFDKDKSQYLVLRPFSDRSRFFCPEATFYIEDGAHRSLAIATMLKSGSLTFFPLKCIVILPKQEKSMMDRLKLYL